MSRPLSEIKKSVPGAVLAGVKREVRHTKAVHKLRKMSPEALAAENTQRKQVGLPPHYVGPSLKRRLTTITR